MLGRLVLGVAVMSLMPSAGFAEATRSPTILPAGFPLRIALDHRYPMRPGTRIEGHLTSAVYLVDHIVLPVDTPVYGVVTGQHPVSRSRRVNALLDGDFTPLAVPEIQFERLQLPDGNDLKFSAAAIERNSSTIRMSTSEGDKSIIKLAITQFDAQKRAWMSMVADPGKSERLRQYVYAMLPYHPQDLWTGNQFDAELSEPLDVPEPQGIPDPLPLAEFVKGKPVGMIEARLTRNLTSGQCPVGMAVEAILTKPLFDQPREHVLLPEGARLTGSIIESRPAARFGRNGRLRFTFRKIELAEGTTNVRGVMTGAESGQGADLEIDSEGGARATTPNRALGTLALAVLAASSRGDEDRRGSTLNSAIVSNGFGLMGRFASMATGDRNVASGFSYYALAKNVYRRWIARGKDVVFPRNTRVQIELAER